MVARQHLKSRGTKNENSVRNCHMERRARSHFTHVKATGCCAMTLCVSHPVHSHSHSNDEHQTIHLKLCARQFIYFVLRYCSLFQLHSVSHSRIDWYAFTCTYRIRLPLCACYCAIGYTVFRFKIAVPDMHPNGKRRKSREKRNKIIKNRNSSIYGARRNHDKCTCECVCRETCRFCRQLAKYTYWRKPSAFIYRTKNVFSVRN